MNDRALRIKQEINIESVLQEYGYDVYVGGGEQQFRCDLHGDGSDNAPSARVYPQTNSWFCFACGKSRDAISTVIEKEGLSFNASCTALESKYGLSEWVFKKKKDVYEETKNDPSEAEFLRNRVYKLLKNKTDNRELSVSKAVKLWEAFDFLSSLDFQSSEQWQKLYNKIS